MLVAKERLELIEFPLRQIHDDEILVRIEACGICGTDIHCFKNDPFRLIPVVLGHEGTGEVVQAGGDVCMDSVGKPVRVGDRIVTSTLETTEACMIAKYNPAKANLCDDLRIYGLLPDKPNNHFNGYFGKSLIIRPGSSFFVVNDMSLDLRVLIEPAAAAHAPERAKKTGLINFRSRVIVQGCGPIGLMLIAIVGTAGANNIIATDGNPANWNSPARWPGATSWPWKNPPARWKPWTLVISNAGGCGGHLKNYAHLLHADPAFAARAQLWSQKLKDIHEWLAEIGLQRPAPTPHAEPRDVSRVLPPVPRPEDHTAAARGVAGHSRPGTGGIAGIQLVLRQRGHLQHHPAGDVEEIAGSQTRPPRPHRRDGRGLGHGRQPQHAELQSTAGFHDRISHR